MKTFQIIALATAAAISAPAAFATTPAAVPLSIAAPSERGTDIAELSERERRNGIAEHGASERRTDIAELSERERRNGIG